MSVHNWGENSTGIWRLEITDRGKKSSHKTGTLFHWSLTLWGIEGVNVNANIGLASGSNTGGRCNTSGSGRNTNSESAHVADHDELDDIMDKEQETSDSVDIRKDREWNDIELYMELAEILEKENKMRLLAERSGRKQDTRWQNQVNVEKRIEHYKKEMVERQQEEVQRQKEEKQRREKEEEEERRKKEQQIEKEEQQMEKLLWLLDQVLNEKK